MQKIINFINNFIKKLNFIMKKYFLSILAVIILIIGVLIYLNISGASIKPDAKDDFIGISKVDLERIEEDLQKFSQENYIARLKINEILSQKEVFQSDVDFYNYNVVEGETVVCGLSENFLLRFDKVEFGLSNQKFIFEDTIKKDYSIMNENQTGEIQEMKYLSKSLIVPDEILKSLNNTTLLHDKQSEAAVSGSAQKKVLPPPPVRQTQKPKPLPTKNQTQTQKIKTLPEPEKKQNPEKNNNSTDSIKDKVIRMAPDSLRNLEKEKQIIDDDIRTIYDLRRLNN